MRPTTKDLAKAAGVSLATVDRVLNERPNVSARAVQKVHDAIKSIGFERNLAAVNLARNRIYRFLFVLPERGDQYLSELLAEIESARRPLKSELVEVDVSRLDVEDPHAVANLLSSLQADEVSGVALMAPESPQTRDAVLRLNERGIGVVQFLSGQANLDQHDFVGHRQCRCRSHGRSPDRPFQRRTKRHHCGDYRNDPGAGQPETKAGI